MRDFRFINYGEFFMENDVNYKFVSDKIDKRLKLYRSFSAYCLVNIFLALVNLIFTPNEWWFYWVTIIWGIFILINFLNVFFIDEMFTNSYREKKIQEELNKINKI